MKPLTRLDKITLTIAFIAFAVTTVLGWYVRSAVGGEEGRAAAMSIFALGVIVVLFTAIYRYRDLLKRKNK